MKKEVKNGLSKQLGKGISKELDIHRSNTPKYYKEIINGLEKELEMRIGKHVPTKYDKEFVERKEKRSSTNFEPDGENKTYDYKTTNRILNEKILKMYVL